MFLNSLSKPTGKEFLWTPLLFYVAWALLMALVFSYALFSFKAYLQSQTINEVDQKISVLGSEKNKMEEQKLLDYKRKISDYELVFGNHKISSNLLRFIEEKTLSNIWFASFSMSQSANDVKLSGEAENMETLSRQIEVFEKGDYVKDISILNSEVQSSGKVKFVLNFDLDSKIFTVPQLFP